MSLIPYGNNALSVVLKSPDSLVVYDKNSKTVALVSNTRADHTVRDLRCPECGQIINLDNDTLHDRTFDFRDFEYFSLLQSAVDQSGSSEREANHGNAPSDHHSAYTSISTTAFSQGYFEQFFRLKKTLGKGSRGTVYLVEHVLDGVSLGLFAVKKVPVGDAHTWLEKVLKEVQMLRMLSHPNLVGYNHVWLENSIVSQFVPEVPCAFILQEYCDGGSLEDFVENFNASPSKQGSNAHNGSLFGDSRRLSISDYSHEKEKAKAALPIEHILSFMIDITTGVQHLHETGFIHRDLKPSNCLLASTRDGVAVEIPRVLVSDFGEGQPEGKLRAETGTTGTLEYCAPELVTAADHLPTQLAQFSRCTDVFSLGMILYYLCYSKLPYSQVDDYDVLKSEVQGFQGFDHGDKVEETRKIPKLLRSLLVKMISRNPEERPSTSDILGVLVALNAPGHFVEEETGVIGRASKKLLPVLAHLESLVSKGSGEQGIYFLLRLLTIKFTYWRLMAIFLLGAEVSNKNINLSRIAMGVHVLMVVLFLFLESPHITVTT